jgi:hypothetical protein
MNWIA